ncbi:MAG: archaeosine biosynthesis radical SAM protein RaSEA [Candidatus Thorarchaeota archaeon]
MESFKLGTEVLPVRRESFEKRTRKLVVYSKLETTTLSTGPGTAFIALIPTVGCTWALSKSGGCSMCGYPNDSTLDPETDPAKYFIQEWDKHLEELSEIKAVKIFNSGSFLDPKEVPFQSQKTIFEKISTLDNIEEVIIESRPEYINLHKKELKELTDILQNRSLWIGVGLETSNDYINQSFINKGFNFEQFLRCVKNATGCRVNVKSYVLLKPPFLTEKEAIEDAVQTIHDSIKAGCKIISLNPVTVHGDTLVDKLYKKRQFSPPWLWSVLEVLKRIAPYRPKDVKIICEPVALGKDRGSHNCGECDFLVGQEIEYYSLYNEFSPGLSKLKCPNSCADNWRWILENEGFLSRTSPIFFHRWQKKKNDSIAL